MIDLRGLPKVLVDSLVGLVLVILEHTRGLAARLALAVQALLAGPLLAQVLDLLLVVERGVVVLADTVQALLQREVLGVDSNTVVVVAAAGADVAPAALLLLEVEPWSIGQEEESEQHTGEAEPGDEVELSLVVDIVVEDRGK